MCRYSLIIPSYNDAQSLKNCLESLKTLDYPKEDFEIIVVDNNSSDNTKEIAEQHPEAIYLNEEKRGASFARNKGITHAQGNILIFLDSDTQVSEKWLRYITEPFKDEKVGAVGGAIYPLDDKNFISQYLGVSLFMRYHRYGKMRKIKGYPSCNLAVRKELIAKGFDTVLFTTYGEDKDICYRILKKGFNIIFQPDAIIYHHHPTKFSDFFKLLIKSSEGRAAFRRKYPLAPDILLFRLHLPLFYLICLAVLFFIKDISLFTLLIIPTLIFLLYTSFMSYVESKRFLLSFIIKPVLDIFSIYTICIFFHFSIFFKKGQR